MQIYSPNFPSHIKPFPILCHDVSAVNDRSQTVNATAKPIRPPLVLPFPTHAFSLQVVTPFCHPRLWCLSHRTEQQQQFSPTANHSILKVAAPGFGVYTGDSSKVKTDQCKCIVDGGVCTFTWLNMCVF